MAKLQTACIKCGLSLESLLYCFSCKTIQSFTSEDNYFELIGLSIDFEIDDNELEEKYHKLSFVLHPDFFESASEAEKKISEKASSILNTSYNILCDHNSRASYLLKVFSQNAKLDNRSLPDGFLKEMFFLQESLDELLESDNKSELLIMKEDLMERHKRIIANFTKLFKNLKEISNQSFILQDIQTNLNAERYLSRLLERIN